MNLKIRQFKYNVQFICMTLQNDLIMFWKIATKKKEKVFVIHKLRKSYIENDVCV